MTSHRLPLGQTGWWVWRDVLLRSAGFPAAGLERFAQPEVAAAADAVLSGAEDPDRFDKEFAAALHASARVANEIAGDPLIREAITWQNTNALPALDGLLKGGDNAPRNVRRRDREKSLLLYWQRYCGKSETIGFFGPVCWASLDEDTVGMTARVGPELTDRRKVFFEAWALVAYADRLAEDPAVRRWWAPSLPPHLLLDGRKLIRPLQPATELTMVDAAVLSRCDGRTPAWKVVQGLLADSTVGVRTEPDGFLLLEQLVRRGLLSWDAALPSNPDAELVLRDRIAAIGDKAVRARASAGFDRLCAGRDAVAAAAGDPVALLAARTALDTAFTELTGMEPRRRSGQMYAGRTVIYEDTTRNIELTIGRNLLDEIAVPLAIVLRAARWLTAELAAACEEVLDDLYTELSGDAPVRLADVWVLAQGLLFSAEQGPTRAAAAAFTAKWSELFGLDEVAADQAELQLDGAELTRRAELLFDAARPGWPSARIHSADLQIGAADLEAINHGDCQLVLGELHPAITPFDSAIFSRWHPDPVSLRAAHDTDIGPARMRLLYPANFPRQTTRTWHGLTGPLDCQLGIDDARGAEADRIVPATGIVVERVGGELTAILPDGRTWPLIEVFAHLLGVLLVDSFKMLAPAPHTPRITIDRLVVARRTWRTTVGETDLVRAKGERERFLAVRRWRQRLGLPERIFVKIGTETKPCYVDLRSPFYASAFCAMLRVAAKSGDDVSVVIGELLPGPEDAWLTDAQGRGYVSELRLQITDPETHRTSGELA